PTRTPSGGSSRAVPGPRSRPCPAPAPTRSRCSARPCRSRRPPRCAWPTTPSPTCGPPSPTQWLAWPDPVHPGHAEGGPGMPLTTERATLVRAELAVLAPDLVHGYTEALPDAVDIVSRRLLGAAARERLGTIDAVLRDRAVRRYGFDRVELAEHVDD